MGSEARSMADEGEGPPRTAPGASTQLVSHLASSGGGPFLAPLGPWGRLRCGGRSACSKWSHGVNVIASCQRAIMLYQMWCARNTGVCIIASQGFT